MEDKHKAAAEKIVDKHIEQSKIINKYRETIDKELSNIKNSIISEATTRLSDWHINKETDQNALDKIINGIDYNLSKNSSVKLTASSKRHGLTGRDVDIIEVSYEMSFDEDDKFKFSQKDSILLESIKLRNKLSKLSKL